MKDNFFCPHCQGLTVSEQKGFVYCSDCGYFVPTKDAITEMANQLGPNVIKKESRSGSDVFITPMGKVFFSHEEAAKHYLLGDK